ncbi:MAG TPA: zinc-dependent metalloprotease [Rhodocyclaceae bacterium]|nr:zinc-dependent metalloprotease [Rhodocyclaceae bacterium]
MAPKFTDAPAPAPGVPVAGQSGPVAVPVAAHPTVRPAAPPPPSVNPNLKPFNDVIKDATRSDGFLPVYRKDNSFYMELRETDFDKPMFYAITRTQGIGERGIWGGMMVDSGISIFRRFGNDRVQWVEKNTNYIAPGNKPMERAVEQGFADSLIGVAPIVSQPNTTTKDVLIDVTAFVLTDVSGTATRLEQAFRQPYGFDRSNSQILDVHDTSEETGFNVRAHYGLARLALPGLNQAFAVSLPSTLPDPRSMLLGFYYSFSPLPEPMTPRVADPRVGYFFTTQWDYHDDLAPTPRVRNILRWRLEKKDVKDENKEAPSAKTKSSDSAVNGGKRVADAESPPAVSPNNGTTHDTARNDTTLVEPKKPIVYWIDRNVPERYRNAVREGILMWNAAFERIGFKNAIVVKQQPDDATFDTAERGYASVKWFLGVDNALAIGPNDADPRTGEILDADVVISDIWTRGARHELSHDVSGTPAQPRVNINTRSGHFAAMSFGGSSDEDCDYAEQAFDAMQNSMDMLIARGEIAPNSPEADAFVQDTIKSVVAHEIGHTLGLSHNFHASAAYTPAQLRDPAFVAKNGIAASVMDYTPSNIGLANEPKSAYVQTVLGPYDYWAIEYGYKEIPHDQERAELERIASRGATNPFLAYGTDIDAGGDNMAAGIDPDSSRFDLGSDPTAYFDRRLKLSRELWDWLAVQPAHEDDYVSQARGSVERSLGMLSISAQNLAKVIGGIRVRRATDAADRSVFNPVPATEQRAALDALARGLFSTNSFQFDPALLRRLVPNQLDRADGNASMQVLFEPELPVLGRVLNAQTKVLDQVLSDRVTTRVLESGLMSADKRNAFQLPELLGRLQQSIWEELKSGSDIDLMRRNLQRAYLQRLTNLIVRPDAGTPADMRSLARAQAITLRGDIDHALKNKRQSPETRAHLSEAEALLDEALHAPMVKPLS